MEIVLNFDNKELVIKEKSNVEKLYKRLTDLLGKDLKNWNIVSDVVYRDNNWWYYGPWRYYYWPTGSAADLTLPATGIYCITDKAGQYSTVE